MKAFGFLFVATLTAFSAVSQAGTLSASALQCGGYASLELDGGKYTLNVERINPSKCDSIEIKSLGISGRIPYAGFRQPINSSALGNKLVLVFNDSEVVILDAGQQAVQQVTRQDQEVARQNNSMTEYERRSIQIQQQRNAREQAQQNAEAAAAAAELSAELGGALIEGAGSIER